MKRVKNRVAVQNAVIVGVNQLTKNKYVRSAEKEQILIFLIKIEVSDVNLIYYLL